MKIYDDEIKKKAKADYTKGITLKDISDKYSIPYSTVQTWRKKYWQDIKGNDKRKVTAPKNNSKAGKGPYAMPVLATMTEEEKAIFNRKNLSAEELLTEEINLLTIREGRILKALDEYRNKEEYNSRKVQIGEKSTYLKEKGKKTRVENHVENSINIVLRLETELTKVQGKKTANIEKLANLKMNEKKAKDEEDLMSVWVNITKESCNYE